MPEVLGPAPVNETGTTRRLTINTNIDFGPGGKIHRKRLVAVQEAVNAAIDKALTEQLPSVQATVDTRLSWSYIWIEEANRYMLVEDTDDEPDSEEV